MQTIFARNDFMCSKVCFHAFDLYLERLSENVSLNFSFIPCLLLLDIEGLKPTTWVLVV